MARNNAAMMAVICLIIGVELVGARSPGCLRKGETMTENVTADNFPRAESDMYFIRFSRGEVGVLTHQREPANADNQRVVRDNPNVLGSVAVFDLDAGPVTLTMPDAGDRFVSLMVTDEDHYTYTTYDPGEHTLAKGTIGTRYVFSFGRRATTESPPRRS